jgi:OmpA-OmpF porin, OOP family
MLHLLRSHHFRRIIRYLIVCTPLFLQTMLYAGTPKDSLNKVITSLKKKAIKYDKQNDIYNAIEYYRRYLVYKNKDIKLTYRLATLYFNVRDYGSANQYYDSVIHLNSKKFGMVYYYKGSVCMNLEKYSDAVESFTKFRKAYKANDKSNYRKLAALYAENAEWAKNQPAADGGIALSHPGEPINHTGIDFSPFPIDDNTIMYGAICQDTVRHIYPVRQLYKAMKVNGQWRSLGLLGGEINQPEYNTGNAVLSDDGQRIFFTRSRKNWQDRDICEIYVSHFDGNTWQTPEKLPYPINDENYTSTQPALGKNLKKGNEVLYFVSDRPGGKGGLDIWFCEYNRKLNTYSEPVDLEKNVNSIGDDCCPFYDISSSTLYFSSNTRKNGLGGFDIYKTTGSSKKWADAIAMPKPVNSSFDDYYFTILKSNKEGYFTSNRTGSLTFGNGHCCDDIFAFKINDCVKITSRGTVRNSVNYDLYDRLNEKYHLGLTYPDSSALLPDVPVELYLSGEKDGDEILISKTTTNKEGNYSFELDRNRQYQILIKNYGYFEKRLRVNTSGINCSDTIHIGNTAISYLPKINVRINILYQPDAYELSDSAMHIIDLQLMPLFDLFPNGLVEIGSHTDSTGTYLYNMELSQKRSESVVRYLVSKGISHDRLVAKGYGMNNPVAPNTNSDGTDNPAGRQLNRRTEIKIVGEMTSVTGDE